jgi:DNA invertase Pin-like site-specific DNA recombinase
MLLPMKVRAEHLNRKAIVYIRQSSLAQVRFNRESTERQYALQEKAQHLGWNQEQIQLIDEDLGISGSGRSLRQGFQSLVAQVSLGQVGAIFGLEISRLARSSADLLRLLELCALFNTIVVDEDGIYDLSDFNDRLILGFKGTMSEAELHFLRARMLGGKKTKHVRESYGFRCLLVFATIRMGKPSWILTKRFRLLFVMFFVLLRRAAALMASFNFSPKIAYAFLSELTAEPGQENSYGEH